MCSFTLFAPSDESFTFLPGAVWEGFQKDKEKRRQFIMQHVVPGTFSSAQVQNDMLVNTARGQPIRCNLYDGAKVWTVSGAQVIQPDLRHGEYTVHVIDHFLYPSASMTNLDYIRANFDKFHRMLTTGDPKGYITEGVFTVFVPAEEAFQALPDYLRDSIFTNSSVLHSVLLNHIVPTTFYRAGFPMRGSLKSLDDQLLRFRTRRGLVLVNGIPIVTPDITVTNGVIHVVNRLLLPPNIYEECNCVPSTIPVTTRQALSARTTPLPESKAPLPENGSFGRRPTRRVKLRNKTVTPEVTTPVPRSDSTLNSTRRVKRIRTSPNTFNRRKQRTTPSTLQTDTETPVILTTVEPAYPTIPPSLAPMKMPSFRSTRMNPVEPQLRNVPPDSSIPRDHQRDRVEPIKEQTVPLSYERVSQKTARIPTPSRRGKDYLRNQQINNDDLLSVPQETHYNIPRPQANDNPPRSKTNSNLPRPETNYSPPRLEANYNLPRGEMSHELPGPGTNSYLPRSDKNYDIPRPKTNSNLPQSETNYNLPRPEMNYGLRRPESNYNLPQAQTNYNLPRTETNYGLRQPESNSNPSPTETEYSLPPPETNSDLPRSDKKYNIPRPKTNNNLPRAQTNYNLPRPEMNYGLRQPESNHNLPQSETNHNLPRTKMNYGLRQPETNTNLSPTETEYSVPLPETNSNLPRSDKNYNIPRTKTNNNLPQAETNYNPPRPEMNYGLRQPETNHNLPQSKTNYNIARTETNYGLRQPETNTNLSPTETEYSVPLPETNSNLPRSDKNYNIPRTKTNNNLPQAETNYNPPRPEMNYGLRQPETNHNLAQSKTNYNNSRTETNYGLHQPETNTNLSPTETEYSLPPPETNYNLPASMTPASMTNSGYRNSPGPKVLCRQGENCEQQPVQQYGIRMSSRELPTVCQGVNCQIEEVQLPQRSSTQTRTPPLDNRSTSRSSQSLDKLVPKRETCTAGKDCARRGSNTMESVKEQKKLAECSGPSCSEVNRAPQCLPGQNCPEASELGNLEPIFTTGGVTPTRRYQRRKSTRPLVPSRRLRTTLKPPVFVRISHGPLAVRPKSTTTTTQGTTFILRPTRKRIRRPPFGTRSTASVSPGSNTVQLSTLDHSSPTAKDAIAERNDPLEDLNQQSIFRTTRTMLTSSTEQRDVMFQNSTETYSAFTPTRGFGIFTESPTSGYVGHSYTSKPPIGSSFLDQPKESTYAVIAETPKTDAVDDIKEDKTPETTESNVLIVSTEDTASATTTTPFETKGAFNFLDEENDLATVYPLYSDNTGDVSIATTYAQNAVSTVSSSPFEPTSFSSSTQNTLFNENQRNESNFDRVAPNTNSLPNNIEPKITDMKTDYTDQITHSGVASVSNVINTKNESNLPNEDSFSSRDEKEIAPDVGVTQTEASNDVPPELIGNKITPDESMLVPEGAISNVPSAYSADHASTTLNKTLSSSPGDVFTLSDPVSAVSSLHDDDEEDHLGQSHGPEKIAQLDITRKPTFRVKYPPEITQTLDEKHPDVYKEDEIFNSKSTSPASLPGSSNLHRNLSLHENTNIQDLDETPTEDIPSPFHSPIDEVRNTNYSKRNYRTTTEPAKYNINEFQILSQVKTTPVATQSTSEAFISESSVQTQKDHINDLDTATEMSQGEEYFTDEPVITSTESTTETIHSGTSDQPYENVEPTNVNPRTTTESTVDTIMTSNPTATTPVSPNEFFSTTVETISRSSQPIPVEEQTSHGPDVGNSIASSPTEGNNYEISLLENIPVASSLPLQTTTENTLENSDTPSPTKEIKPEITITEELASVPAYTTKEMNLDYTITVSPTTKSSHEPQSTMKSPVLSDIPLQTSTATIVYDTTSASTTEKSHHEAPMSEEHPVFSDIPLKTSTELNVEYTTTVSPTENYESLQTTNTLNAQNSITVSQTSEEQTTKNLKVETPGHTSSSPVTVSAFKQRFATIQDTSIHDTTESYTTIQSTKSASTTSLTPEPKIPSSDSETTSELLNRSPSEESELDEDRGITELPLTEKTERPEEMELTTINETPGEILTERNTGTPITRKYPEYTSPSVSYSPNLKSDSFAELTKTNLLPASEPFSTSSSASEGPEMPEEVEVTTAGETRFETSTEFFTEQSVTTESSEPSLAIIPRSSTVKTDHIPEVTRTYLIPTTETTTTRFSTLATNNFTVGIKSFQQKSSSTTASPNFPVTYIPVHPTDVNNLYTASPQPEYQVAVPEVDELKPEFAQAPSSIEDVLDRPNLEIRKSRVTFHVILKLFSKIGFSDILRRKGTYTLCIPTDSAFRSLPDGFLQRLQNNVDMLRKILLHHVLTSQVPVSSLKNNLIVRTYQGQPVIVNVHNSGKLVLIGGARVLGTSRTRNGVLYVVDRVLYDLPQYNLLRAIRDNPELGHFYDYIVNSPLKQVLRGGGPLTLLAPTNDAFNQLSPEALHMLATNQTALEKVLYNHLADGAYFSAGLRDGLILPTPRGGTLHFTINSDGLQVNDVKVLQSDVTTGNGVLHIVDQVLLSSPDIFEKSSHAQTSVHPTTSYPNLAELAEGLGVNKFVKWFESSGLLQRISNSGRYTILAPTDDAVDSLPHATFKSLRENPTMLHQVLRYHVVRGFLRPAVMSSEDRVPTLLPGKDVRFIWYRNGTELTVSGARLGLNRRRGQLSLQVINKVLYPPTGNIMETISKSPLLRDLSRAVRMAGLDKELSSSSRPFTLFAPSQEAFNKMPLSEYKKIFRDTEEMKRLLTRHMSAGTLFSSGVSNGMVIPSESGSNITITTKPQCMVVDGVNVVYSDITATNGVVHVLNHLL